MSMVYKIITLIKSKIGIHYSGTASKVASMLDLKKEYCWKNNAME